MPRGRPKRTDAVEAASAELREQAPPIESDAGLTSQTAHETADSHVPKTQAEAAPFQEEAAVVADGLRQEESPDTLLGYMAENFREDIRAFMQNFGINGHQPESVFASVMEIAEQLRGEQSAAEAHAGQQEQVPAPDEQQSPVPLNVRITSLEMDGDTRALATAEYGDLTVRRIRVKEDDYGTLSVAMPKFRQPSGWQETCAFNTVEARNRLTGAVLDAYGQKLAQIQAQSHESPNVCEPSQTQDEAPMPEATEQGESIGPEKPGQDGPVMGGMTL